MLVLLSPMFVLFTIGGAFIFKNLDNGLLFGLAVTFGLWYLIAKSEQRHSSSGSVSSFYLTSR